MGAKRAAGESDVRTGQKGADDDRLRKLWDAYVLQERGLRATKERISLLEADIRLEHDRSDRLFKLAEELDAERRVTMERIAPLDGTIAEQGQVIHRLRAALAEHGLPVPG